MGFLKVIGEIEKAILEETAYGEEPLHGIIYGLLKDNICKDPEEIIASLLNLLASGRIKIYYHSGWGGDPYLDITSISLPSLKEYLLAYIEKHKAEFNKQYLESGGEFFVEATN